MALLGQVVSLVGLAAWNPGRSGGLVLVIGVGVCMACLLLAAIQVVWVDRSRRVAAATGVIIAVRLAVSVAFAIGWIVLAPGYAAALVWPLGVYVGLEYSITASYVGSDRSASSVLARVLVSPLHLGAILGLVAAAMLEGRLGEGRERQLPLEVAFALEVVVVSAVASYAVMNRIDAAERVRCAEINELARSSERRRRAHWIHDDVCADLRNIRIKVATRAMTTHDVTVELDELDYRMRVRQLDEILEDGSVSAAEVMQPYLRRVQNAGVRLVDVPRYEDASIEVPYTTATLMRRALAGLLSNAVAAGCSRLSIRLRHQPGWITLSVEDDAGGFELSSIPAGRGLWSLANEVGTENLSVERGAEGAVVVLRIPVGTTA